MKRWLSVVVTLVALGYTSSVQADEVTLVAPGGMRCAVDKLASSYEASFSYSVNATIGAGGATHQQVVKGTVFDVVVVQPPYADVIASGNIVASSETPLAMVPLVVVVKKGALRPDISTPEAVKTLLLGAKAINYPDGNNGLGGAAGVSFDNTLKQLGIFDQVQPKVRRPQGVSLLKQVSTGDIDFAVTFASEAIDPDVDVVGVLPSSISTPTALVGFLHVKAKFPDAAAQLLEYLSGPDATVAYTACGMTVLQAR